MKACFVFAVLLVAFAVVSSAAEIRDKDPHSILKRETIRGPEWPNRCVFYECVASCQRGGHSGGQCNLNGCNCVG